MRPLVVFLAVTALCACGLKDDLYLPEPKQRAAATSETGQAEPAAEEQDDTDPEKRPPPSGR